MLKGLILSTDMVDPDQRNEFWREIARPMFDVSSGDGEGGLLEGAIQTHILGGIMIGSSSFNRQIYRRDHKTILESGFDHYLVQFLTEGSMKANFEGAEITADPGDICVFDLSRPFTTDATAGKRLTVMLPRNRIDSAAGGRSLHGEVFRASDPVTKMLGGFITNLSRTVEALPIADALAMEASIMEFFAASLSRSSNAALPHPATAALLRQRALQQIEANLSDPLLGPDMLIDLLGISRAYLYRIFSRDGGVSSLIRERRLDAAFRLLTTGGHHRLSIAEIAHRLGFSSAAHFSRAFRARFALSPREVRQEQNRPTVPPSSNPGIKDHFARLSRSHYPD